MESLFHLAWKNRKRVEWAKGLRRFLLHRYSIVVSILFPSPLDRREPIQKHVPSKSFIFCLATLVSIHFRFLHFILMITLLSAFLLATALACSQFSECATEESALALYKESTSFDPSLIKTVCPNSKRFIAIGGSAILVAIGFAPHWVCSGTQYRYYRRVRECCEGKEVGLDLPSHVVSKSASFRVSTVPTRKSTLLSLRLISGQKDWRRYRQQVPAT